LSDFESYPGSGRALGWLAFWFLVLACLLLAGARLHGGEPLARYGIVRVSSHGGSANVIATGPNYSLVLSAAHMFRASDRGKPVVMETPTPFHGVPPVGGTRPRVLDVDPEADLALVEIHAELPYCVPVAPASAQPPQRCLSVGYDELQLPPQMRPVTILERDDGGGRTLTRERPWHGRSGGALIDEQNGWLVGVVSGYTGPRSRQEVVGGAHGIYASHKAVVAFLRRNGYEPDGAGVLPSGWAPQQRQYDYRGPEPSRPSPRYSPPPRGGPT